MYKRLRNSTKAQIQKGERRTEDFYHQTENNGNKLNYAFSSRIQVIEQYNQLKRIRDKEI